ncbi:MAG TPA: TetR/AcrR family transcriptional regulator [Gemmatimonadales bacterium]|nr:TetR/AcrR family transcriptional regulator [Gemmatimonadales bacterium]
MKPADLTRQRLVRAALELFTTQGYHATTTPHIARKAGIAEGTIYRHFVGKQQLLNELYRGAARWAVQLVRQADSGPSAARERLTRLAELLVEGAGREPAVVRLFFFQDVAGLLDEASNKSGREFRGALETLVAQGKSEGTVRAGGVDVLAAAWLGVMRVALERILVREWGAGSSGVRLCAEAAWDAIKAG